MSSANSIQVGGSHYLKEGLEQHWDRMWKMYKEAWFVGNITKYVERYRDKNGVEDLKKAAHYLQKLIELETEREARMIKSATLDAQLEPGENPKSGPKHLYAGTLNQLIDIILAIIKSWRTKADKLEEGLSSGKWYTSMTEEEQKDFNHRRDVAYGIRTCANEIDHLIKEINER